MLTNINNAFSIVARLLELYVAARNSHTSWYSDDRISFLGYTLPTSIHSLILGSLRRRKLQALNGLETRRGTADGERRERIHCAQVQETTRHL